MRHSTSRQFVLISDTHLPELLKNPFVLEISYLQFRPRKALCLLWIFCVVNGMRSGQAETT